MHGRQKPSILQHMSLIKFQLYSWQKKKTKKIKSSMKILIQQCLLLDVMSMYIFYMKNAQKLIPKEKKNGLYYRYQVILSVQY